MSFTSTLSLCSHPQARLQSPAVTPAGLGQFVRLQRRRRTCAAPGMKSRRSFVVKASSSSRRVYHQSQQDNAIVAPVKQIANFVAPFAVFFAVTFVIWKLVEKVLVTAPKESKSSPVESESASQGVKWSFGTGTNLLSQLGAKIDRQSKQKLNEFAQELKSCSSIDMSGRNFGDEGLFFLAESLAFNRIVEEVSFAANGITAAGLRAFDGVLQSNITLKTLDLSGNPVGDEGAKCLCEILVHNSSIEKLQLNSTDLGDEGAKAIAEMLKRNSSLRVLELNNNMIEYSVCNLPKFMLRL